MSKSIRIRKGMNIRLVGEAEKVLITPENPDVFAIKPPDFHGLTPKMTLKEGEKVKAGSVIFFDKYNDKIKFTSPVSGTLSEIVRGAKRRILEVRIKADGSTDHETFKSGSAESMSREDIKENLLASGLWPMLKQRPIDIVANPDDTPKAIFISGFDTNPLAPDYDFIIHGNKEVFQKGLDLVAKLTDGKVHLTLKANGAHDEALKSAKNVQINRIDGPHPAGNVGTQIHHIDPINKGEKVWTLNVQDVLAIGRLFTTGKADYSRVIAITGSKIKNPKYYKVLIGTSLSKVLENNVHEGDGDVRIISGNPLTGDRVDKDGFLGFYHHQVTALPEGNEAQFFMTDGWLSPGLKKKSLSRSYPSWLMPNKKYNLNTNQNGEERAFVVSGQYEQVFPFDIYPVFLLKAIITNDIDKMEQLGIYEVIPEDFALCEYVCTSKINVQSVVRDGLDVIQKECM